MLSLHPHFLLHSSEPASKKYARQDGVDWIHRDNQQKLVTNKNKSRIVNAEVATNGSPFVVINLFKNGRFETQN